MSDLRSTFSSAADHATPRARRGQTLVEFALVLPMLLVLLLGIVDFGRVFASGITVEALARNAAEAGAQEYLQARRASAPAQPTGTEYAAVHARVQEVACEEAETLANRTATSGTCTMPVIGSCIHDEWGENCSSPSGPVPPSCNGLTTWPPALASQIGGLPYVQVTTCYQFTTLINLTNIRLPLGWSLTLGEVWLQRERAFTVADY
jgi:hypothetical protein